MTTEQTMLSHITCVIKVVSRQNAMSKIKPGEIFNLTRNFREIEFPRCSLNLSRVVMVMKATNTWWR